MGLHAIVLVAIAATGQIDPFALVATGDTRATEVRDTNTVYTMTPFTSRGGWNRYAENLRRQIRVATGLWPMFEKTPLHPTIFDTVEHEDYSVSKVHFEAWPGFLVTGNLYMPPGDGPFPAIIGPHGHWALGRLDDSERGSIAARHITFARMGIAAFSYDMVGYQDSRQLPKSWGHSGGNVPPERRMAEHLWAIHPFAVQLWSSIRVLDFISELPQVDPNRIGCTGASGGGTQTFAINAIDDRVKVSSPVNMISHTMQGGCPCENAPLIRIHASNMEIGALFAPKPMLMVSATGDWTKLTPEVEFPAIRSVYELYGAGDQLSNAHVDAGHNYNLESREAVYRHFGKYLLGEPEKYAEYKEPEYHLEEYAALKVFPGEETEPPASYPPEEEVINALRERIRDKWIHQLPKTYTDAEPFRKKNLPAFGDLFGIDPARTWTLSFTENGKGEVGGYAYRVNTVKIAETGAVVPILHFTPPERLADTPPVLLVHSEGAHAFANSDGTPGPLVRALLDSGISTAIVQTFNTGPNAVERAYGKFPDTFMPTDTAYRVQDIVAAAQWLSSTFRGTREVNVVGLGDAGVPVVLAAALEDRIGKVMADFNGFNPNDDAEWVAKHYVPCIRSLGDILTAAYLVRPRGLWIMNAAEGYDTARLDKAFFDTGSKAFMASPEVLSDEAIVEALK